MRLFSPLIPNLGTLGTEVGPMCICDPRGCVHLTFFKQVSKPELVT